MVQDGIDVSARIRAKYNSLSKSGKCIADYVQDNFEAVLKMSIADLASVTHTSEATIMRFCRQLEYDGYSTFKLMISREIGEKHVISISSTDQATGDELIKNVFVNAVDALDATLRLLNHDEFYKAVTAIEKAKRIDIYGVANSASVGDDLMNKLLRLGIRSNNYGSRHLQLAAAATLTEEDVVIAISHSGMTKEIVDAAIIARQRNATIISITNYKDSVLFKNSSILLLTGDPESDFYSETMASRIAQLAIVDCLFKALFDRNKVFRDNNQAIKWAQRDVAY